MARRPCTSLMAHVVQCQRITIIAPNLSTKNYKISQIFHANHSRDTYFADDVICFGVNNLKLFVVSRSHGVPSAYTEHGRSKDHRCHYFQYTAN